MKVITEAYLREELGRTVPEAYYIPEGKILSPAAREYLMGRRIKILSEAQLPAPEAVLAPQAAVGASPTINTVTGPEVGQTQYIDYATGACYFEKPIYMTKLHGNVLVPKDHPLILFRGKLESFEALLVLVQTTVYEAGGSHKLLDSLDDLLDAVRELSQCEFLHEEFKRTAILGMTCTQQQEKLLDPLKHFGVAQLAQPDYTQGRIYNLLYQLYTAMREVESVAVAAFREGHKYTRKDILKALNRLSGALQIMMYMYLAGEYK